jgi:hypothetical protein
MMPLSIKGTQLVLCFHYCCRSLAELALHCCSVAFTGRVVLASLLLRCILILIITQQHYHSPLPLANRLAICVAARPLAACCCSAVLPLLLSLLLLVCFCLS